MTTTSSNGSSSADDSNIVPFTEESGLTDPGIVPPIDDSEADRIELLRLHESDNTHQEDALHHINSSIENRIREGEILTKRRDKCKYGEWLPWIRANAPYGQKTVWNRIDLYRDHCDGGKLVNVTNLTDAYLEIADDKKPRKRRSQKKPKSPPEPKTPDAAEDLRTRVINALCAKPWKIPRGESSEFVDLAEGNTEEEIIRSALRLREQSKRPGQVPPKPAEPAPPPEPAAMLPKPHAKPPEPKPTQESKEIPLEVCSEPPKPQNMTGADVFVPESCLQHREHLGKGIVDEEVGKVPIKDYSGLPQKVRLEMLIGFIADQFAVTLECVKQLKIACNASCQTKGALEHLIHLVHLSWEPLNRIADHVHIYVAPDDPKGEDPDYMI